MFQDVVLTVRRTEPELPLVTTFNDWFIRTVRGLGRPVDMGLRLAAVFADAGLQVEHLTAASPVERGGGAVGYAVMAGDVTSLLPHMERLGIASARDVVPETFEQRLRTAAAAQDAVLINPLMVGASARGPSAGGG